MSLRESLKEEVFNQRTIANDDKHIEIKKQLDHLYMDPGVDMINENCEISINFMNIEER